MTLDRDARLTILTATAANRVQTLWLVFSSLPAEQRGAQVAATITAATDPETVFANLLFARRGNQVVAATWIQAAPGKTAVVWPPQLVAGEPETTAAALFDEVVTRLKMGDVDLAQAIQQSPEGEVADRLRRHGFQFAAKLLYLTCEVEPVGEAVGEAERFASRPPPGGEVSQSPLHYEPFDESQADRLIDVIERTYVQTQDIPILNDMRAMPDVLHGYRHTGDYDPRHWFFVRSRGNDVGCLLLADHPSLDQVELVYMGVVPEARGQGHGGRLVEQAKRHTLHVGRRRIILGVDGDNGPALLSYTAAGFHWCQERFVFLRSFRN